MVIAGGLGCAPAQGDGDSGGTSSSTTTATTATTTASITASTTTSTTAADTTMSSAADGSSSSSSSGDAESSSSGEMVNPQWQAFLDARQGWLEQLGVPILACSANMDTNHPAFHGCIDWHSHVHATYALHVIYRVTGAQSWLDAANDTLEAGALAAELADLQDGGIAGELPYGYAWFLLLAIERERTTGQTDLVPMATEIAAQLSTFYGAESAGAIQDQILADDYGNGSWAALNLWRWSQHAADAPLADQVETLVDDVWPSPMLDEACPLSAETMPADFFPPCLHRAMTIIAIEPPMTTSAWLDGWLVDGFELTPLGVADVTGAHLAGVNFSRAWGLWHLWLATGDTHWRDLYAEHIEAHMALPELWAENYGSYAHWVAQFGVHAIALSYE